MFGAKSAVGAGWSDDVGPHARVLKPTRFMSNSVQMLRRLHKTCSRNHAHQPLLSGRAGQAALYPLPLLKAILLGMSDTEHENKILPDFTKDEYDV